MKAIIIDGNSLMFRAYYGTISQLSYFDKYNIFPTNAIKTLFQMLYKIIDKNQYEYAVIAFDHKDPNFRKQKFQSYKSTRKQTPESLVLQIDPIKQMCEMIGFNCYCISGIEADDIVGSVANLLSKKNIECEIFSSDNDLLQLVDENIKVFQPSKGENDFKEYNKDNFSELTEGLFPKQIIDYKSISGDASDNIAGIKGIGKKSALMLLNEYKSIDNIYENIDNIKSKSLKEKLINGKESAYISKELVTILTNYFDDKDIEIFKFKKFDLEKLDIFFKKYSLKSLEKYLKKEK